MAVTDLKKHKLLKIMYYYWNLNNNMCLIIYSFNLNIVVLRRFLFLFKKFIYLFTRFVIKIPLKLKAIINERSRIHFINTEVTTRTGLYKTYCDKYSQ